MAISEFRTDRIGRLIAASAVLSEAKADNPRGVGPGDEAKAAIWTGWAELLRIKATATHSDIPPPGTRIAINDRVKAARVVVLEVEPMADKDIMLGLHVFEMAQYAFEKVVRDYDPGAKPEESVDDE